MKLEHQRLEKEITHLQARLDSFPEGKLVCSRNHSWYKWYHSDGHKKVYIPKKNRQFAEQLAEKKYLTLLLQDAIHEKKAIEFYLRHHHSNVGKVEHLLTESSGYHELLSPCFSPLSQELEEWTNAPYAQNTNYPQHLTHRSISGHLVRSKSESLIDTLLYLNKIPFRYENPLELGTVTLYPDFTIRHPQTGKYIYWDHFGMMDNSNYAKNAVSKLQLYISNGIIPSIHLITTYETLENPLTSDDIEKLIQHYFS